MHFSKGLLTRVVHFYKGLSTTFMHFYKGLSMHAVHFYKGLLPDSPQQHAPGSVKTASRGGRKEGLSLITGER